MNLINSIDEGYRREVASFNVGDTVRVFMKVIEGDKERIQPFEGIVIARKNGGIRETFTVRKMSFGVGVERIFPLHSPFIQEIKVVRQALVRQAKLYYLREKKGKAAKLKEKQLIRK